jgi:hypothetical protein
MLLDGTLSGNQSPFLVSMRGHIIPQERIPPNRTEMLIIYGHIIPTPTYVAEKSK